MTPMHASRVQHQISKVSVQLHDRSLAETATVWGSTPEQKCGRWQEQFQKKADQVKTSQASLSKNPGALASANLVLKLRGMVRTYETAARNGCEWVTERDVETEGMQDMVQKGLGNNPCFPQAQALMAEEYENMQQQAWAMSLAVQMLSEEKCTPEDLERFQQNMEQQQGAEAGLADDVDLEQELDAVREQADEETDKFVEAVMDESEGSSLLQVVDSAAFIHTLEQLVGLVAFLLIWAVLCLVFVPVIIMVIGAVLCTLAWVVHRVLGRHKDLHNCLGWWAHQMQSVFAPGNELAMAGACLIAGWLGVPHAHHFGIYFPGVHVHHR